MGNQDDRPVRLHVERAATNIPAATFNLIGRSNSILHVRDLLSVHRVVTLTGPGGIGKTALALEVARNLSATFRDGCLLVELASLSSSAMLLSAVAGVTGLKLGGQAISAEFIARAVRERQLLLILDNCEHLVDPTAELTEALMNQCGGITVFATSREVLRVDGEQVYRVPPLEVPPETGIRHSDILGHPAVELFISRAQAFGSDLTPDDENLSAIASICRRLDGIPLAIEFAAARAATEVLLFLTAALMPLNRREIMNRQSMLGLTAASLIGLASSVSFGIANGQDTGKNVISTLNAPARSLFTGDPSRRSAKSPP